MLAFYRSVVVGAVLVFADHLLLTVIWWFVGVPEMVWYHAVGLPLLAVTVSIARRGRIVWALALASLEFIAHASLGTYYAGWETGMHFPVLAMAIAWAAYPGGNHRRYRNVAFLMLGCHVALLVFGYRRTPIYALEPIVSMGLSLIMLSAFVIAILVILVLQNVSAGWYESLQMERDKSERLLLNVLPGPIADRLREREEVIADRFDSASVLFLDIVDFTKMSSRMTATEVVSILNEIFCIFDGLTERHGMEKIKTIGDAYMAVAGIPLPQPDHARRTAHLALDMLASLKDLQKEEQDRINARIGICSGPVVAGVIGRRKFIYDLWGDTVNTASRMESHSIPNRIQVTDSTYQILREDYRFESRGIVEIKGKGPMPTYFLVPNGESAASLGCAES